MNIKTGDNVFVIAGRDKQGIDSKGNPTKGYRQGKVLKVFIKENRVLVEGVNKVKKHTRPTQGEGSGGILEQEAPIHVSNVMLVDPKLKVPTRVGYRFENGKKVRYAKKSGTTIDEVTKRSDNKK